MSIKRIFIAISAIFAASAVFADNSSVTSKKYVDDIVSGYQEKLPGSGANKLMIYDDETGIGEKSIEATLVSSATGVPTVGAVKTGLDGVQDTITGTAGYVMTGTGTPGEVGEKPIYSSTIRDEYSLVTAESVNSGVINAVNHSLRRVNANGELDNNGTLWEIADTVVALTFLPAGYTQLEYIESTGTQYIDTGIVYARFVHDIQFTNPSSKISLMGKGAGEGMYWGQQRNGGTGYEGPGGTIRNIDPTDRHVVEFGALAEQRTYLKVDDTTITGPNNASAATYSLLGISWSGRYRCEAKLYDVKAYDVNDALILHLVPARHNSDNAVGMYDTVSGTFFRNAGEGEFTAGQPVGN